MNGLDQVAAVTNSVFTDPKIFCLVLDIVDNMKESFSSGPLADRLLAVAKKDRDPAMIQRTSACLWNSAHQDPRHSFFRQ